MLKAVLEHILVVALCGGLVWAGATYLGHKLGASLNHSAELVAHPESAGK